MHPILFSPRRLALYLLAWAPLGGLAAALLAEAGRVDWWRVAAVIGPAVLIYAFVCLSAWYLCRFIPIRPGRITYVLSSNATAAAVAGALWIAIGTPLANAAGIAEAYAGQRLQLWVFGFFLFLLASAAHYVIAAVQESREAQARELQAGVAAREAELRALKAQINPHFLFNSLHAISALTTVDPGRARQVCILLSDFLRKTLGLGERERIPLAEELDLARNFLAIQQVRFGSRLTVSEDIEEAAKACPVPALLLQPLVENAVTHGIAMVVDGGFIKLEAKRTEDSVAIAVENTFDPESPKRSTGGLGLANVRKRLEVLYGPAARMDVITNGAAYRVEMRLPAEPEVKP